MKLSENIYRLRRERRMSQGDLAEVLEVSRQSVSKWETGAATPELDKLMKMSQLFGISLDALVGETPAPSMDSSLPQSGFPTEKLLGTVLVFLGGLAGVLGFLLDAANGELFILLGACTALSGLSCLFLPYPQLVCGWCAWGGFSLYTFLLTPRWEKEFLLLTFTGLGLAGMLSWTIWAHTRNRVTIPRWLWWTGGFLLTGLLILFAMNFCPPFFIGVSQSHPTQLP